MSKLRFPKSNPISISIDKIAFNNITFGDVRSASAWPQSVVSDILRAEFTIANNSADVTIPYSVVTGDVLDGDAPVMSSGRSKSDFFASSSTIDYPLGPGEKASDNVTMKWDSNWVSKSQAKGYCVLYLQLWGQYDEYHPDQGDLSFTVSNPEYDPKAPKFVPLDPNDPESTLRPNPKAIPTKGIFFRMIANATSPIDIYPPCGDGGDFLSWPELSARIFMNGNEVEKLPVANYTPMIDCHYQVVPAVVSVGLSWKVSNGGFAAIDDHLASVSEVTISGPGITGEMNVQATKTESINRGVVTSGNVDPIQISGMKVIDAIRPYVLMVKGRCGQVQAFTVLLPESIAAGTSKTDYQNWGENQTFNPEQHFWPSTVEELVAIVQQAEKLKKHVRAVGSRWSYSDVGVTDGYLVFTNFLNRTLGWAGGPRIPNTPPVMHDGLLETTRGRKLYHVEGGIMLRELCDRLDDQPYPGTNYEQFAAIENSFLRNASFQGVTFDPFACKQVDAVPAIQETDYTHPRWALPTMGGSGGQALAGAISTSVHGGDFNLPPLPGIVRAIHLVGPGGKQYWIERSDPITDRSALVNLLPNIDQANVIYDDEWFRAVLVSVGSMGIIYSLVIEVWDQYGLEEVRAKSTWRTVRPLLADGTLFSALPAWLSVNRKDNRQAFTPRFLELDFNPYPEGNKDHVCFVRSRSEVGVEKIQTLPPAPDQGAGTNDIIWDEDSGLYLDGLFGGWSSLRGAGTIALGRIANEAQDHSNVTLVHDLTERLFENIIMDPSWLNVTALSYKLMDTYDYSKGREDQWRVLSLAMVLDASNNLYLDFIDSLFTMINDGIKQKKFIAGAFFIRFTGASDGFLAMQQTNRSCHIEMDLLKYADSSVDFLDQFASATVAVGGRLHWGLNATKICSPAYPNMARWQAVRAIMTDNGRLDTFDNEFSSRCGLT